PTAAAPYSESTLVACRVIK
nr:hypothetical protein [Tanacetum cinerariifolium]